MLTKYKQRKHIMEQKKAAVTALAKTWSPGIPVTIHVHILQIRQ